MLPSLSPESMHRWVELGVNGLLLLGTFIKKWSQRVCGDICVVTSCPDLKKLFEFKRKEKMSLIIIIIGNKS